jgi:hypothetical protein
MARVIVPILLTLVQCDQVSLFGTVQGKGMALTEGGKLHPDAVALEELLVPPAHKEWNQDGDWFRHEDGINFLRGPIKSAVEDYGEMPATPRLMILGTDNRDMDGEDYWSLASLWNHAYCRRHGYIFRMIVPELPPRPWTLDWKYQKLRDCKLAEGTNPVPGPGNCTYNNGWTKAKMLIRTMEEYPSIEYFIFLDSDAVISPWYFDQPLLSYLKHLGEQHKFDMKRTPIMLNQDAYAAWCHDSVSEGFHCINAGTMVIRQDSRSREFLSEWFNTGVRDYDDTRRRRPWKWGPKPEERTPMFSGNPYRRAWLGDQMLLTVLATEKPWDQLTIYEPFPEYPINWTITDSVQRKSKALEIGHTSGPSSGMISTGMPYWTRFFPQNYNPLIERFARKEGDPDTGNPDYMSEGCQAALKYDHYGKTQHEAYKEIFGMCPIRAPRPHAYCLSHLPYANCFIQHFCEGAAQKKLMTKLLLIKLGDILSCEVVKLLMSEVAGPFRIASTECTYFCPRISGAAEDVREVTSAFCTNEPKLESVKSRTRKLMLLLKHIHKDYVEVIKW